MTENHVIEKPVAVVTPGFVASLEEPRYRSFELHGFEAANEIEELEAYKPGGFCPIDISLPNQPRLLNDRFQVIYKLGFGGFGPRLSDLMEHMLGDDPDRINRLSYQIVKGMGFLHQHGICHGDFRPQNVLLKLKDGGVDEIGIDEMRRVLGPPVMIGDIAIVDFGESYATNNPNPPELGIPRNYAAPEIIVGGDKGIGTDLWSLGCTLMALRCRILLYTPPYTALLENDLEEWKQRGKENGALPPEPPVDAEAHRTLPFTYITKTSERGLANDECGRRDDPIKSRLRREHTGGYVDEKLLERTRTTFRLTEEEINAFCDLLHKIFQWQPERRWDTARIMGHEWFAPQQKLFDTTTDSLQQIHSSVDSQPSAIVQAPEVSEQPSRPVRTAEARHIHPAIQRKQSGWSRLIVGVNRRGATSSIRSVKIREAVGRRRQIALVIVGVFIHAEGIRADVLVGRVQDRKLQNERFDRQWELRHVYLEIGAERMVSMPSNLL
ncbi:CMGC protein kinase [Apiospora phragmitis]|uniref:EKC/KEOPS complex subunit BUD32 n=1 Tax=Apiospora phragmitis TaxID=2905665 RepID=A0ABR1VXW7_9PEZI